ncbi:MAG: AAA family ATPase [Spirochaetota bacterium]
MSEKLRGVFKPEEKIGRLCRNDAEKTNVQLQISPDKSIEIAFTRDMDEAVVTGAVEVQADRLAVFIPPKEMLSSFPGFTSLYLQRELAVDETYFDLCLALETPKLKEGPSELIAHLLQTLAAACGGEFLLMKQQRFYYKPFTGRMLEVDLAAEGFRKLGMVQRLLQNGRINPGASGPLFWDEPESNLNPSLMKQLVTVLVELARNNQQLILATHDYVMLKWFDLLTGNEDKITYHSLFKGKNGEIQVNSTEDYQQIHPNAIDDAFASLIDQDVARSMGELGK